MPGQELADLQQELSQPGSRGVIQPGRPAHEPRPSRPRRALRFARERSRQIPIGGPERGAVDLAQTAEKALRPVRRIHPDLAVGTGFANDRMTKVSMGLIDSMRLGDAVLSNVPVAVLPALTGVAQGQAIEDMIILGTGILQHFLSTWDNREERLVLSPRHDPAIRDAHMNMLPGEGREMEFFLHGDHYLLASGSIGEHPAVFFVDTGLVAVDSKGRQASLGMTSSALEAWRLESSPGPDGFVDLELPITLGPVSRDGGAVKVMGPKHDRVWNDMPIQALLSFGFLKHFVWTIDFDRRRWFLTSFGVEAEPEAACSPRRSSPSSWAPTRWLRGSG